MEFSLAKKPTIYYVFDPFCSWCFGFTPVMLQLKEKFADHFDFEILSGGMVLGSRVHSVTQKTQFFLEGYQAIEECTGARFGKAFLEEAIYTPGIIIDSEVPSRALFLFKEMQPDHVFTFAHAIQEAFYVDGLNLNEKAVFGQLAARYGVGADYFTQQLKDPEYRTRAFESFAKAKELGAESYPTVILEDNGKVEVLFKGYRKLEDAAQILQTLIFSD